MSKSLTKQEKTGSVWSSVTADFYYYNPFTKTEDYLGQGTPDLSNISPSHDGYILAKSSSGYYAYLQIIVTPTLELSLPKPEMCDDEEMTIKVSGAEGVGVIPYDGHIDPADSYSLSVTALSAGTLDYASNTLGDRVIINNNGGPSDVDSYTLTFSGTIPSDDIGLGKFYQCPGVTSLDYDVSLQVVSGAGSMDILDGNSTSVMGSSVTIYLNCTVDLYAQLNQLPSSPSYYMWEPSAGLDDPHSDHVVASPTVTTIYTVHAVSYDNTDYGCCAKAEVTVIVDPSCECVGNTLSCLRGANPQISVTPETHFSSLAVYPNPNAGLFGFTYNNTLACGTALIQLYSMTGELLLNEVHDMNQGVLKANLVIGSSIAEGTYLLMVSSGNNRSTQLVQIEK